MGENKHPSIFFHLSISGLKLSWGERQSTPWKGHQSITGLTHGERQPFTPSVNLELPINFMNVFGLSEETGVLRENLHRDGEKMEIPHRKSSTFLKLYLSYLSYSLARWK